MNIPFKKFRDMDSIKRFKETQQHIVELIIKSDKKVIMLNAPTGVGKTIIGMMAGSNLAQHVNYIGTTKLLQAQIQNDFPEANTIKGRGNYVCNLYKHLTASSCLKKCSEYALGDICCDYYEAKIDVLKSKYRILNMSYYLSECNYVGQFSGQEVVVIDEADRLEDELINFISLKISENDIDKYGLRPPRDTDEILSWLKWSQDTYNRLMVLYDEDLASHALNEEFIKGVMFMRKIRLFNLVVDETWVFNNKGNSWQFKPVWLDSELTNQYLWKHAEKFVLMSATLPKVPIISKLLGLNLSDADYIEVDSPYELQNRLIHYKPVLEMSQKNKDMNFRVIDEIESTLEKHKNDKGIIHTVSYKLRDEIMEIGNERLITHDSDDKEEQLEIFRTSSKPLVFVSPSSERGLSLDGDLARFCIWAKVPFANLGDKQISSRVQAKPFGSRWYSSVAAQTIIQGAGRGVRNGNDFCATYIFDAQFERLIPYFPGWFKEAIVIG